MSPRALSIFAMVSLGRETPMIDFVFIIILIRLYIFIPLLVRYNGLNDDKRTRDDDSYRLLQSLFNLTREIRNEQRMTNDNLRPLQKLVHDEAIQHETSYTRADFEDKEAPLIEYVRRNPGQSKKDIIAAFNKGGGYNGQTMSPSVTLQKINELEKDYDVFMFRPDPDHKQKHCVYINDESLLLNIKKTLDGFKEALIVATEALTRKVIDYRPVGMVKNNDSNRPTFSVDATSYLKAVMGAYQHFISMIILQALIDWPQDANNNPHTLRRAYQMLFVKLNAIQEAFRDSLGNTDVDVRATLVSASWLMRPGMMLKGHRSAEELELLSELSRLYTAVWTVSDKDFDQVEPRFTPKSLIEYHDESTLYPLYFGDKPVSWEMALKPGLEELRKGVQVSYETEFSGESISYKDNDGE